MNAQTFAETLAKAKADKAAFDEMRKAVEAAPATSNGTAWRDELLSVPTTLSPRLSWMMRNKVVTYLDAHPSSPWVASGGENHKRGVTEEEAIVALAKANGWKLWFEL